MPILINIVVSAAVMIAALNVPASWVNVTHFFSAPRFGTAFTQLSGSNAVSSFPTTYNNNLTITANTSATNAFSAYNTFTTAFISTLNATSSLIDTLVLTNSLGGSYGGTASSSLSTNQVMLGNGTSGLTVPAGFGTSGQFLTSAGAGAKPTWTTASFDQTLNYNLTGTLLVKNLNASSTAANPIVLNGVSYNTPTTQGAAGTFLKNDGTGALTFAAPSLSDVSIDPSGATTTEYFLWSAFTPLAISGTGSLVNYGTPSSTPFAKLVTGTTFGGAGGLVVANTDLANITNAFAMTGSFKFNAKFTATSSLDFFATYGNYIGGTSHQNAFGWEVQNNVFACFADNGVASSSTTFSTGFDASKIHTYEVRKDSVTSIGCYVDGALAATVSTNVPTATTFTSQSLSVYYTNQNTSSKTIYVFPAFVLKHTSTGF